MYRRRAIEYQMLLSAQWIAQWGGQLGAASKGCASTGCGPYTSTACERSSFSSSSNGCLSDFSCSRSRRTSIRRFTQNPHSTTLRRTTSPASTVVVEMSSSRHFPPHAATAVGATVAIGEPVGVIGELPSPARAPSSSDGRRNACGWSAAGARFASPSVPVTVGFGESGRVTLGEGICVGRGVGAGVDSSGTGESRQTRQA